MIFLYFLFRCWPSSIRLVCLLTNLYITVCDSQQHQLIENSNNVQLFCSLIFSFLGKPYLRSFSTFNEDIFFHIDCEAFQIQLEWFFLWGRHLNVGYTIWFFFLASGNIHKLNVIFKLKSFSNVFLKWLQIWRKSIECGGDNPQTIFQRKTSL